MACIRPCSGALTDFRDVKMECGVTGSGDSWHSINLSLISILQAWTELLSDGAGSQPSVPLLQPVGSSLRPSAGDSAV